MLFVSLKQKAVSPQYMKQSKYNKLLAKTKRSARQELTLEQWREGSLEQFHFHAQDNCERINYEEVDEKQFKKFERQATPKVIQGAMIGWRAMKEW